MPSSSARCRRSRGTRTPSGDAGRSCRSTARFSGFVFKIQANMDPRHRDRIAFLRICSGKFERDMTVTHARTGKKVRLSSAHKLFGQERETVDEAYAGDVIGLVGHTRVRHRRHAHRGPEHRLRRNPALRRRSASPTCTIRIRASSSSSARASSSSCRKASCRSSSCAIPRRKCPLLAAVGPLQFEVVQYRLESEYGAESSSRMRRGKPSDGSRPAPTPRR